MEQPPGLAPEQFRALARLSALPALSEFYLAGGTAVAHHFRHRVSRDLDLFSASAASSLDAVQRQVTSMLRDAEVIAISDAALQLRVEGVPVDFVSYPHPLLEPTAPGPGGFPVAGLLDLATMKLAAIARRGLRRDFWDLHELLTRGALDLDAALDAYLRRFGKSEPDLYHVLRALTYFDDAVRDPVLPLGLTIQHWQVIQWHFESAAPAALLRR